MKTSKKDGFNWKSVDKSKASPARKSLAKSIKKATNKKEMVANLGKAMKTNC